MTDTIELLDTIGSDASLRHASAEQLSHVLEQANASEALSSAAASGDSSLLFAELGQKPNQAPQGVQSPSHEEEEKAPLDVPEPEDS